MAETITMTLNDNPNIKELLELLKSPGYQAQRQEYTALLDGVDAIVKQYNTILTELDALKEKVSKITDRKNPIVVMVDHLENLANGVGEKLKNLRDGIDCMSHAALCKARSIDYTQDHRISLSCLSDKALAWYLKQHPEIKQIIFAFDNDTDGKGPDGQPCNHGQEAAKKFAAKYMERGYETAIQTPSAKDFNEDLMAIRREQAAVRVIEQETNQESNHEQEDYEGLEQ